MQTTRTTDVLIIGAGQAGLAMSRCLAARAIDHVVLERGEVANSWTSERWDSLRLLTPNWMSRLPSWSYHGDDPDGYMSAVEVAAYLQRYRRSFDAPVETHTVVESVTPTAAGFRVDTNTARWTSRAVVLATGACSDPHLPSVAAEMPGHMRHLSPIDYRRPDQIDDRPVLVVGASASGIQIADELASSGRAVTLAVGEHGRVPRMYRGLDIHWWMDQLGILDERCDEVDDLVRARHQPSLQLIGSDSRRTLDLNTLGERGIDLRGRLVGVRGRRGLFSGSLANVCALADLKQHRLLDRIDDYARRHRLDTEIDAPDRPVPTRIPAAPLELDLTPFGTVIWATGFRPRYPWLDPSLLDRRRRLAHDGGILPVAGAYVLGLPFLRRRKSSFIDGVGDDARQLAAHLASHLDRTAARSG
jgi:putative flavoprotein involved in K+ transport